MSVPLVDYNNSVPLYDYDASTLGSDENTADNGVLPYLNRLTYSVATGARILPMQEVAPNSSYQLEFLAPAFQCSEPRSSVQRFITQVLNYSSTLSGDTMSTGNVGEETNFGWLAFPPVSTFLNFVDQGGDIIGTGTLENNTKAFVRMCIVGADAGVFLQEYYGDGSGVQCEGINPSALQNDYSDPNAQIVNNGRLWFWTKAQTLDCTLKVTSFRANFSTNGGQQVIDSSYTFNYTDQPVFGSHFAIAQSISNVLTGGIRGFQGGLFSYKTSVAQTALLGALPVSNASDSTQSGLPSSVLTPAVIALARGKTVGELIEELSRNVSLSLFSASEIL